MIGRLAHGTCVSFLKAVRLSPPQTYGGPAVYYPQWVALGQRPLQRTGQIAEVSFSTPDAATIFYDWRSFGAPSRPGARCAVRSAC